jgi:guanine nucleotide-binding protein subunit beta-2-like 1 protein
MSGQDRAKIVIEYAGSLKGHNGWVTSLAVGKDSNGKTLLVSGSRDKKIIIWNLNLADAAPVEDKKTEKQVGKPLKALSGHSHFVSGLSLSKDSKFLVSSSWDKTLRLWDLNTFKTRFLISGHSKDVLTTTFSNEDRAILSGSMDKTLKVWNTKGELKHTCTEFNGWVSSVTHVKQEKQNFIAVGSWEGQVKLFNQEYALQNAIEGFDYGIVSTQTDADGEFLFSAEKNGKIRVHSLNGTNSELKSVIEVNGDINAISYDSTYFMAIAVASSKGLLIHEVNKVNKTLFEGKYGNCLSLAWDESKTYLFAGFADGVIRVFKFGIEA